MPTMIPVITEAEWAALQATLTALQVSVTALETATQNPLIVDARAFPGADAGLQISAAIAALPQGVGGLVNAWFPNPQTLTGFTIPPGVTVQFGPGFYTLRASGPSIVVQQGGRLRGMGTNSPGATTIKAANGLNKDVVRCVSSGGTGDSSFWHHGLVTDLRIDGNKAQNVTGHGVSVYSLAEVSQVTRLNIFNCAESGLYVHGSQSGTGSIENVTVNSNGRAGVHLDEFRSGMTLKCVGGDNNPITFEITRARLGGGSILLIDPKSEGAGIGDAFVTPVIRFTGPNAPITLTIVGGNFLTPAGVDKSVVQINADSGNNPTIQMLGLVTGNAMPLLIDDRKNAIQIPCTPLTYHSVFAYCGGKVMRFDPTGFSTVP